MFQSVKWLVLVSVVALLSPAKADDALALREYYDLNPGMIVFEVGQGDGHFTTLLSNAVGPEGRVFAHYTRNGWRDAQDDFTGKFADHDNIVPYIGDAVTFGIPDKSLDVVMVSLTWANFDRSQDKPRSGAFLKNSLRLLKPGGVLAIVENGQAKAKKTIEGVTSAGFEYVGAQNTVEVQGHETHYALKFRKPLD